MPEWLQAPWAQEIWTTTSARLPTLGIALGILVGGWLGAFIVQKLVHAALNRTTIDDKIATAVGIETGGDAGDRIERIVAKSVYYILLTFVVVAFFGYLKIDAVTAPLVSVLTEFTGAVPNLLKAAIIGVGGFLLATGVRKLLLALFEKTGIERRVLKLTGEDVPASDKAGKKKKGKAAPAERPISTTLADIAYWFIIIVVAIPVFESLQISALANPLSAALATITTYLPRVGGAAVLLVAGYVVSRIVRSVVTGVLARVGLDRAVNRLGFGALTKEQPLSSIVGAIAMTFVLLHFAISAVGRLQLEEISAPLGTMLHQIYAYLPKLLVGGVLMAIGIVIARLAGNLAARLLAAMGFNTLVAHIGLFKDTGAGASQEEASKEMVEKRIERMESDEAPASSVDRPDQLLTTSGSTGLKTPADIAGLVVGTVVVLLFLRQVLGTLGLSGLAGLLDGLLAFLPHMLVAAIVLGAGMWAGGWAHQRIDELTKSSSDRLVNSLGTIAHVAIVAFAAMVSLQQLGVGKQLIAIAFGLILGAVCLALALAFGLGGREVAGKILNKEYDKRVGGRR